ncbi:hypothetical protein ALC53_01300 [Atta colombica]|uniref:Uncharacterized protein n=1 Tax=Atta colombica TaxID=520822 RepID=A0A195BUI5_9HYME|nr:hypothetical protein ALC53_01300 [Atta colombica]
MPTLDEELAMKDLSIGCSVQQSAGGTAHEWTTRVSKILENHGKTDGYAVSASSLDSQLRPLTSNHPPFGPYLSPIQTAAVSPEMHRAEAAFDAFGRYRSWTMSSRWSKLRNVMYVQCAVRIRAVWNRREIFRNLSTGKSGRTQSCGSVWTVSTSMCKFT